MISHSCCLGAVTKRCRIPPASPGKQVSNMDSEDEISLHSLSLIVNIGPDCWSRNRAQPVLLTFRASIPLARAAETDDIQDTVHYGHLANAILDLQSSSFPSLLHLANTAISEVFKNPEFAPIHTVHIHAEAPKLLLKGCTLSVDLSRRRNQKETESVATIKLSDLALFAIIGVNPPERIHKQQVIVSISFPIPLQSGAWLDPSDPPQHQIVVQQITDVSSKILLLIVNCQRSFLDHIFFLLDLCVRYDSRVPYLFFKSTYVPRIFSPSKPLFQALHVFFFNCQTIVIKYPFRHANLPRLPREKVLVYD